MSAFRRLSYFGIALVLVTCGPKHEKGDGVDANGDNQEGPIVGPHKLSQIEVTPLNPLIELDINQTSQQTFQAIGHYLDGQSEDLTAQATWESSNPAVGTLTGPQLDIPGFAMSTAQTTRVKATFDGYFGEAQLTVVAYRKSGAQQDFFFILPYVDPAGNMKKPLDFATAIPALDVFFLMDTTGSMSGEIANLKSSLTGTVIPGIQSSVTDSQFGVGAFMDFPINPFGWDTCANRNFPDQPFELKQAITNNNTAITNGVNALANPNGSPIGCGRDLPESLIEGIYQAATGEGLSSPSPTNVPANHTGIGGVGFRQGTMPVIVAIGDATSHTSNDPLTNCSGSTMAYGASVPSAHSRAQTKTALANICSRVVGIAAQAASCNAQPDLEELATTTGARVPPAAWDVGTRPAGCAANQCCTGQNGAGRAPDANGLCPIVFQVATSGAGLGPSVVTGIQMLTRFATFDVNSEREGVTTDVDGNPLPAPHNTVDFIKTVTPVSFVKPAPPPVLPDPTFDTVSFHNVTPATTVQFDVEAFNDFVMQIDGKAQFFRATIRVLAGGCTPLDAREVLILVPPAPVTISRVKN